MGAILEVEVLSRAGHGEGSEVQLRKGDRAVAHAFGRKFLGYCLWQTRKGEVKRAVAAQALQGL